MIESIFIRLTEKKDLDTFSSEFSVLLGVDVAEVRYSDHVAGGRYRRGHALGFDVTLREADDAGFGDYDFELVIEARREYRDIEDRQLVFLLANFISACLSKSGFEVVRPPD